MWIERNSTLRGMSAVGLAFLLNSCGGDTQVIQVLPAMSAEVGGAGAVSGSSGGSGGRASNLVGAVSGGSGGSVATIGSGGAVKTSGGAVGIGTGGMASGGVGVPGGSGGAAAGGAVGVGGMSGQTGGVSSGGSGAGGAPPMTEALCKLGMPGTDAGCNAVLGDVRHEFVWGGHCYSLHYLDPYIGDSSWNTAKAVCEQWGGTLASLNCSEEYTYIEYTFSKWYWDGFGPYPTGLLMNLGVGGVRVGGDNHWAWLNGDPWEFMLPATALDNGLGCMTVLYPGKSTETSCTASVEGFVCERPLN